MSGVPSKIRKLDSGDEPWRTSSPDFVQLLRTMFKEKACTDVTLKVGSGINSKVFECHSLLLKAHSPVLNTMLSPRWSEDTSERKITLEHDDPDHFKYFLDMMYMDWSNVIRDNYDNIPIPGINPENAVGILLLAHKYLANYVFLQAEHLIFCFLHNRSPVEIVKCYKILKANDEKCNLDGRARSLLRTVENCILGCADNIFSSDAILLLDQSDLKKILKRNVQCSEEGIYNGCFKWGQEQCKLKGLSTSGKNLRSVLGSKIINSIRFPLLGNSMITKVVLPSKILPCKEMTQLLTYFVNKGFVPENENLTKFNCKPRCRCRNINRLLKQFVPAKLADFSSPHGFDVTLSKDIYLIGLTFYGGPSTCKNYTYEVEIQNKIFRKKVKHFIKINDKINTISVDVKPRIMIKAGVPITIKFTITGGNTYICPDTVQEVTKEISIWGTDIVISKFNVASDLNVANGLRQIPTLIFSALHLHH